MTYSSQSTVVSADAREAWEFLLVGKKLQLSFPSTQAAEKFRLALHTIKARSETQLLSIGFMNEDEVLSLCVDKVSVAAYTPDGEDPVYTYQYFLGKRRRNTVKYTMTVLEA